MRATVEGCTDHCFSFQGSSIWELNPSTPENPFLVTKLLGFSIGRGSGALKGLRPLPKTDSCENKTNCYDTGWKSSSWLGYTNENRAFFFSPLSDDFGLRGAPPYSETISDENLYLYRGPAPILQGQPPSSRGTYHGARGFFNAVFFFFFSQKVLGLRGSAHLTQKLKLKVKTESENPINLQTSRKHSGVRFLQQRLGNRVASF